MAHGELDEDHWLLLHEIRLRGVVAALATEGKAAATEGRFVAARTLQRRGTLNYNYVFAGADVVVVAAVIGVALKYRKPENRAVIVEIARDRRAALIGGAVTAIMLTMATVDGGLAGLGGALVLAPAMGLLVAALVHRTPSPSPTHR